ncbi:MAG: DUF4440 domain-containing protein [Romboutsia sp.]|uniref:nuclear transport factor 2 family protein n=1 Tax=Romboutsia sp. TaxID=1965302 RepID=UPI003F343AB1
MQSIEIHILELENKLLKAEVRKSSEKIRNLVADNFYEICSSGKIYKYNIGDTFYNKNVRFEIFDFNSILLSNDYILTTYKLKKYSRLSNDIEYTLRSSIWKCFNDQWKMIFHQGTIMN